MCGFCNKEKKDKTKEKYMEENKYIQILTMVSCGGEDVSYIFEIIFIFKCFWIICITYPMKTKLLSETCKNLICYAVWDTLCKIKYLPVTWSTHQVSKFEKGNFYRLSVKTIVVTSQNILGTFSYRHQTMP